MSVCLVLYINNIYFRPIPTKNKGFKLLENMGWTPGKSLGSSNSGIKEPVSILKSVNNCFAYVCVVY